MESNVMKKLENLVFYTLLFSLPISLRKVHHDFFVDNRRIFNEYTDVSTYFSDIIAVIFIIVVILNNKNNVLSIEWWTNMFHVKHLFLIIFLPFLICFWSFLSFLWSDNKILSVFVSLKLFEFFLVFVAIIIFIVSRETIKEENIEKNNKYTLRNICAMFHVKHFLREKQENQNVSRETLSENNQFLTFLKKSVKPFYSFMSETIQMFHVKHYIPISKTERVLVIFIIVGLFEAIIAIGQFFHQGSIGITFLQESIFSKEMVGVAKIVLYENTLVRSYGTFPHPNILGAFLAITSIISIFFGFLLFLKKLKMFHVKQNQTNFYKNVSRETCGQDQYLVDFSSNTVQKIILFIKGFIKMFHVKHNYVYFIYYAIIFLQIFALITTFSKSALIMFCFGVLFLFGQIYAMFHVKHFLREKQENQNVSRETLSENNQFLTFLKKSVKPFYSFMSETIQMFHVKHLLVIFLVIVFFFSIVNTEYFIKQSINERVFLLKPVGQIFEENFFLGLGSGQFVYLLQGFFDQKLFDWQFQPVHNLFLLVFVELGFIGLVLFLLFWVGIFILNVSRETSIYSFLKDVFNVNFFIEKFDNKENQTENMFHVKQNRLINVENVSRETFMKKLSVTLWIMIFGLALFDHYFWDIQQGQLLFWILCGIIAATARKDNIDK
ncbi:MAG: O-antigen ligase family protein [Candidatus Moranbacteria bacterium]|nr:O-antigen ligase family protein [Candidatus Moranbacteria bacterium]